MTQERMRWDELYKPGNLVLCHSAGILGAAIRIAERRLQDSRYAEWNHVAVLDRFVDGEWYVIQAEASGVTDDKKLSSVAPGGNYQIIPLPIGADRMKLLKFVRAQVGDKYSWLSIFSAAFDMWLPEAICLRKGDTWICSGLAAAGLWFAGYEPLMKLNDVYTCTPAEIAQVCTDTPR
jgi:hypothetical protein